MHDSIFTFFGFFKIVNFSALVGIFIYLIKIKFIPFLYDKNRKEREYNTILLNEYYSLNRERKAVESECEAQDQKGQKIIACIKVWNEQISKKQVIQKKEQQVSQEKVKKYLENQAQMSVSDYAKRSIAPGIINNTKNELSAIIKNDEILHKKFIEKALQSLLEN